MVNIISLKRILAFIDSNWPLLFVIFPLLFNFIFLYPETKILMDLNDNLFAFTLIKRMDLVLQDIINSKNILNLPLLFDHWTPEWAMGFPVFSYYQHLPHFTVVFLYRLLDPLFHFSLLTVFNWTKYLMLSLYPLVIYYSARKFGLSKTAGGISALVSTLISTQYLYGTDYNALVFRGSGMYTQLWGIFFFPLAVSAIYYSIENQKGYIKAILLLAMSISGHLVFGYMALLSFPVILFSFLFTKWVNEPLSFKKILLQTIKQTAFILSGTFLLLSYWLIPLVVNSTFQNKSFWDDLTKFNSYGAVQIIKWLVNGQIFDNNRLPALTVMCAMGFFQSLYLYFTKIQLQAKSFSEKNNLSQPSSVNLLFPLLFLFYLVLYFGRYSFGSLYDLLPMSEGIHGHRLVNGVHLAGIFLIGLGAEWVFTNLKFLIFNLKTIKIKPDQKEVALNFFFLIFVFIYFSPAIKERYEYLFFNTVSIKTGMAAYKTDLPFFQKAVDLVKLNGESRINIGRPGNWGRNYGIGGFSGYFGVSVNNLDSIGFEPESWSPNTDIEQFFSEYDPIHYRLFNIGYIIAPPQEPFATKSAGFADKIGDFGKYQVYKIKNKNHGDFEFINSDLLIYTDKHFRFNLDRMWLNSSMPKNKQHPTVTYNHSQNENGYKYQMTIYDLVNYKFGTPHSSGQIQNIFQKNPFTFQEFEELSSSVSATIMIQGKKNNYYFAKVKAKKDSILMLKTTFHPFWNAIVDKKPAEKFMVEPSFMAIRIPAGEHLVEFSYFPSWYKNLLYLFSVISFPLLIILRKRIFL